MKKAIYIILACVMLLAGCSNEKKSAEMTTTETSASIAISGEASSKETTEQTTTAPTTALNTAAETTTVTTEAEEPITETVSALQTAITETAAAASAVTVTSTAKTTASTTETSVSETKASESEAATESAAEEVKIAKVISSDNPRSLTKEDKEILANMPEIVFIKIMADIYRPSYVWGYYLNNNGEVKKYEYYDNVGKNEIPKAAADGHIYADYFDAFSYDNTYAPILLDRMHDKIIEKSEDTGIRVEKDKLVDMYKQFLSIDTDAGYDVEKVVQDDSYIFIGDSYANLCRYFYGFRKTDGTEEKVMIDGLGCSSYTPKDTNAYLLNVELCTEIFPIKDYEFTPQLVQLMLGKTPPVTTVIKSENPRELTQEDKDILNEMPEILFVDMMSQVYSGEFIYGFYLNKEGEVRYYEYYDEEAQKEYEELLNGRHWNFGNLDVYSDNNTETPEVWSRMYKEIQKKSIDTGIRVEKDKLVDMYKLLLNVDDEAGFRISGVAAWDEISICVVMSDEYYLGVRKEDKKQQKVLLRGDGYSTYANKDPLASELVRILIRDEIFPILDEAYVPMIVREKENTNND